MNELKRSNTKPEFPQNLFFSGKGLRQTNFTFVATNREMYANQL